MANIITSVEIYRNKEDNINKNIPKVIKLPLNKDRLKLLEAANSYVKKNNCDIVDDYVEKLIRFKGSKEYMIYTYRYAIPSLNIHKLYTTKSLLTIGFNLHNDSKIYINTLNNGKREKQNLYDLLTISKMTPNNIYSNVHIIDIYSNMAIEVDYLHQGFERNKDLVDINFLASESYYHFVE